LAKGVDGSEYRTSSRAMTNRKNKNSSEQTALVYAPLYERIGAFIIDGMVLYGIAISFSLGFGLIHGRSWIMLSAAFLSWIYFPFFYYKGKGQTIGFKIFGCKVISVDGSELSFWRVLLRSVLISSIISPLGFISILAFSFIILSLLSLSLNPTKQKRQTFWDAATKSCVIKGGAELKWKKW
jgi:uncharacterized RDD family membrane protein YckC